MGEKDYLKLLTAEDLPPALASVLDNLGSPRSLWGLFCLLANRVRYDERSYEQEVRDYLSRYMGTDMEYLAIISEMDPRDMGRAFDMVHQVSLSHNIDGIWEAGYCYPYSDSTVAYTYSGNGLSAFKYLIVQHQSQFRSNPGGFYIHAVHLIHV